MSDDTGDRIRAPDPSDRSERQSGRLRGEWITRLSDRRHRVLFGIAVLALMALAGVGVALRSSDPSPAGSPQSSGASEGSTRWPADSLTDWASFADQFSVVSVLDETELPPTTGADPRVDENYIGRQVTLRVERTFWRRPEAPMEAPENTTIKLTALGWSQTDGQERVPFTVRGGPRIEVGRRYLIPLVRADGEWSPVGHGAILTLEGETVTSEVAGGRPAAAAEALKGKTIQSAGRIVADTPPSRLAAKFGQLGPDARYRAVSREGG